MQQPEYHRSGWQVRPILMGQLIEDTDQPCPICADSAAGPAGPPRGRLKVLAEREPDDRTDPFCVLHGYPEDFHASLVGAILRHPTARPGQKDQYTLVVFEMDGHLALHPVSRHDDDWFVDNRHPALWRDPTSPTAPAFVVHDAAPANLRVIGSGTPWDLGHRNI